MQDKDWQTAAMMVASVSRTDNTIFLKSFVEAGADVNMQTELGYTALWFAIITFGCMNVTSLHNFIFIFNIHIPV